MVIGRSASVADIPFVTTDGYAAGIEIAELFVEQGYRRVGYMAGHASERTELRRFDGYRPGLQVHGLDVSAVIETTRYRREQGLQALMRYLAATPREQRIEALFCENDILAIGALEALRATGAPQRVALVGFDDIEMAAAPGTLVLRSSHRRTPRA